MTGRLSETDYTSLREEYDPDQSSLFDYGGKGETTIAVIRKPNGTGIDDVCDEWMPALGMPEKILESFWERRSQYRQNSAIQGAHNRAYGELRLKDRYLQYLRDSDEAQQALDEIVERLEEGEDITLVCFEGEGKACHRHELLDIIESRVSSDFTFTYATP